MKVFLIGYMGVGKSTVGKKLAGHMRMSFTDLDQYLTAAEGKSITDIFADNGSTYFREKEAEALRLVTGLPGDMVISTGGGTPCYFDNMAFMNNHGTTVWLSLPAKMIAKRLEPKKSTRPLIAGVKSENLPAFIEAHLAEREPFYSRAHITFNPRDLGAAKLKKLAEEVIEQAKGFSKN